MVAVLIVPFGVSFWTRQPLYGYLACSPMAAPGSGARLLVSRPGLGLLGVGLAACPVRQLEGALPKDRAKRLKSLPAIRQTWATPGKTRIFSIIHCGADHDHISGHTFSSFFAQRSSVKIIDSLKLLLHSPGGSADIAYQVTRFFGAHSRERGLSLVRLALALALPLHQGKRNCAADGQDCGDSDVPGRLRDLYGRIF